jgi:hypothetical protein
MLQKDLFILNPSRINSPSRKQGLLLEGVIISKNL